MKDNDKKRMPKYLPLFLLVFFTTIIVTLLVIFVGYKIITSRSYGEIDIPDETETVDTETETTVDTQPAVETIPVETQPVETQPVETAPPVADETIKVQASLGNGPLVLANSSYEYNITADADLCRIYDVKNKCYSLNNSGIYLRREVVLAFNNLTSDFYSLSMNRDVLVRDGYLTNQEQADFYALCVKTYGIGKADKYAQKGGCSDCNTGYGFTVAAYSASNGTTSIQGNASFQWLTDNAHKYGFINRYPTGKDDKTGFVDDSAIRYVGIPHATYMKTNNLCLEEYIELLRGHDIKGDHLIVTDANGNNWNVFSYVIADYPDGVDITHKAGYSYFVSDTNTGIAIVAYAM